MNQNDYCIIQSTVEDIIDITIIEHRSNKKCFSTVFRADRLTCVIHAYHALQTMVAHDH